MFEVRKARGPLGRGRDDDGPAGSGLARDDWEGRRGREDGAAEVDAEPGDARLNDRGCVGGVCARGTNEEGCLGGEMLRISPSSCEGRWIDGEAAPVGVW